MTPDAILAQLTAAGIRLQRHGGNLIVTPREAVTDELRALIRDHKAELLEAVEPPAIDALAAHAGCYACDGCRHIRMTQEQRPSNPRRFFWFACAKGHKIIEAGHHGERVLLAPPECNSYGPGQTH